MPTELAKTPASPLDSIITVLVEPQGPRNVGSTARALANFGLRNLRLVKGVSPEHPQAIEMAVHAADLLAAAPVEADLAAAIADTHFVVGTTAKRRERQATLDAREAAPRILEAAQGGRVALVFGREDHGLTADELARCHLVISVPTDPRCRSLNLGQAVLVVAYELFLAAGTPAGRTAATSPGPTIHDEMRRVLQNHLVGALGHLGILHKGNETPCVRTIERILSLGPMQTRDARLLFTLARRITSMPPWHELRKVFPLEE